MSRYWRSSACRWRCQLRSRERTELLADTRPLRLDSQLRYCLALRAIDQDAVLPGRLPPIRRITTGHSPSLASTGVTNRQAHAESVVTYRWIMSRLIR